MPEFSHNVKPIMINYCCDKCSVKPNPGCILEFDKLIPKTSLCTDYTHQYQCPNCKEYSLHDTRYPIVRYEVMHK
jgi:hypothetical protein